MRRSRSGTPRTPTISGGRSPRSAPAPTRPGRRCCPRPPSRNTPPRTPASAAPPPRCWPPSTATTPPSPSPRPGYPASSATSPPSPPPCSRWKTHGSTPASTSASPAPTPPPWEYTWRNTSPAPSCSPYAESADELLEFLSDWLEFDHENLTASLARFVGSPGYGPDTLRGDFARFRFLL